MGGAEGPGLRSLTSSMLRIVILLMVFLPFVGLLAESPAVPCLWAGSSDSHRYRTCLREYRSELAFSRHSSLRR